VVGLKENLLLFFSFSFWEMNKSEKIWHGGSDGAASQTQLRAKGKNEMSLLKGIPEARNTETRTLKTVLTSETIFNSNAFLISISGKNYFRT
jgi:hypothetical protein